MAYPTSADVISAAARELGLVTADIADPFGSTDNNVLQLCVLLNRLGQDLLRDFPWSYLQTEHTFPTVASTADYSMPSGFARIADGTAWNRTQQWPLLGPLNGQQWQRLQANAVNGLISPAFRLKGLTLTLYPTPSAVETVALEYVSRFWVAVTATPTAPSQESTTVATDVLFFDRRLLVDGLRLNFLGAKGFDTSRAQMDFDKSLARAQGGDGAAPALSLSGGSGGVHFLDGHNVPETGYGA